MTEADVPTPGTCLARVVAPLLLALLLTGLNAFKSPQADDFNYLQYAHEFAAHPARPYDFNWGSPYQVRANQVLVPPGLPAWLALGIQLWGERLVALKLWLFPLFWLFTASAAALLR